MEIKVTAKTEHPLMNRTTVEADAFFGGATPSRKDIIANLTKQLHTTEDLLVIDTITTSYRNRSAKILARLYNDKESLQKIELKHLAKRGKKEEKAQAKE